MLAGLVACSSTSPSASPARSPSGKSAASTATSTAAPAPSQAEDVCGLIPTSAVTAVFGGTVTKAEPGSFFISPLCNWTVTGSNLGVDGTVQVIHLTTYDAAKYESAKKDALTRSGVVAVTGIGDDAFYDPGVTSAAVHKGDTVYFVGALFHAKPGGVLDAAKIKAEDLAMAKAVAAAIRP